jgi:hypothetical protein
MSRLAESNDQVVAAAATVMRAAGIEPNAIVSWPGSLHDRAPNLDWVIRTRLDLPGRTTYGRGTTPA